MNGNPKRRRRYKSVSAMSIILGVGIALYTIILFMPILWGLISSLKDRYDFLRNKIYFPKGGILDWKWSNYVNAFSAFFVQIDTESGFKTVELDEMFLNSLLYSAGCAFMSSACAYIMAYLTAKFRYKFSSAVYMIVIVTMIIPIIGRLPSEIQMVTALGLYDSFFSVLLLKANFLGMYFLVFYSTFKTIPDDYAEAAKIDGAGNFTILAKIMIPFVSNTFMTVFLLNFISFWNDYQVPLIYIPSHPTVAYGLFLFDKRSSGITNSTPMKLTGSFLVMLPILIVFMIFGNKIIGNVTMGGLKE